MLLASEITIIWISAVVAFCIFIFLINYYVYKKTVTAKAASFEFNFKPLLLLSISPLIVAFLPIFAIYRQVVNLLLSAVHGGKYGGLFDGRDSVYSLENKNPIHILFIVQYDQNNEKDFYTAFKDTLEGKLKKNEDVDPKLFGEIRTCMGYSYLLKDEVTLQECLKKLTVLPASNGEISQEDLLTAVGEYTKVALPKNRKGFWDVHVGTQPVQWKKTEAADALKSYPVLLRANHTLADALHMFKYVYSSFGDGSKVARKPKPKRVLASVALKLKRLLEQSLVLLLLPSIALANSVLMAKDSNVLHGPKLTYRKHFFARIDDDSINHVQLVKQIKTMNSLSSFEDVFLAAIAASFTDYFKKLSLQLPDYIVAEVPVAIDLKADALACRNRISFTVRKLPIGLKSTKPPLTHLMNIINKEGDFIRNSMEKWANYFILSVICSLLPAAVLRPLIETIHTYTVLITNIPGHHFVTMSGWPVEDVLCFAATRGYTGLGITIHTYNNRLQLTFTADEAVTPSRSDIQSILDGVYKNLYLLNDEASQSNPSKKPDIEVTTF